MNVTEDNWDQIEDKFRTWSFYIYYRKSFRNERDPLLRFVKALVASAQPIRDRQAVIEWYRSRRQRRRSRKPHDLAV